MLNVTLASAVRPTENVILTHQTGGNCDMPCQDILHFPVEQYVMRISIWVTSKVQYYSTKILGQKGIEY